MFPEKGPGKPSEKEILTRSEGLHIFSSRMKRMRTSVILIKIAVIITPQSQLHVIHKSLSQTSHCYLAGAHECTKTAHPYYLPNICFEKDQFISSFFRTTL